MSNRTIGLSAELHQYLLDVGTRESALLRQLRTETASMPDANMQIAPEQGQFLQLLVQLTGARRCIEVGVYTGYSALCIASALAANGELLACDTSKEWTDIARRYWQQAGVAERVRLQLQPAEQTLQQELDRGQARRYDLAFIDADKENYQTYYELCLQLLRPGGLIALDNTLWDAAVIDPRNQEQSTRAIRAVNRRLQADSRIDLSLVPIADGVTLCRKR